MRRPRRARGKDWLGAALIALALLAMTWLAGAGLLLRPPPTDPETLCRTDQPLQAHTIILVDATDKLEPRHRRLLQAIVRQEGQRLARYQKLTIASLRADRPQEPRILFSLCNPGDGRSVNPLFQNTRMAQEKWQSAFGEGLARAVRRAGAGRAATASPNLAALRALAADPDFSADIPARRLVLVSDLLEYAPQGFSLYEPTATFEAWRAASIAPPPDLSGVRVRVAMLDRPEYSAVQTHAQQAFWAPYFDATDAADTRFDPAP